MQGPTMHEDAATYDEMVLYDATLGGTPETQGRLLFRTSPAARATQTFAAGVTLLDTMAQVGDAAGYVVDPRVLLTLDRTRGVALQFTVQIVAEDHAQGDKNGDGISDRAGLQRARAGQRLPGHRSRLLGGSDLGAGRRGGGAAGGRPLHAGGTYHGRHATRPGVA